MRLRYAGVALLATIALAGCDLRSPEEIHPTRGGVSGECIEWDDEPCDSDPFDTDDDDFEIEKPKFPTKRRR